MANGQGQGHGGAGGYGAAPQRNPYGQAPYGQNPYAQPVPPPQPYPQHPHPQQQPYPPQPYPPRQPQSQPQQAHPIAQQPYVAAQFGAPPHPGAGRPGGFPGPAPRRNRLAVLLQFLLQWIYAPLWVLALVLLFVVLILADYNGGGPSSDGWLKVNRGFIPPRRLRAELTGRAEDWERYATPVLARRIAAAEAAYAAGDGEVQADLGRVVTAGLALRLYRGLGADGVVRLVERYGWHGVASGTDAGHVRLARHFPAPAGPDAPAPQDPPAAPGTPWGPQPVRFAPLLPFVFLLQIVYVPVYGLLTCWVTRPEPDYWDRWGARWTVGPRAFRAEFTDSPAAWDRHIRRILKRDTDRIRAATRTPDGSPVSRIHLKRATYRGAGAHQALRLAAEQGWSLDPAYTPDPANSLRLHRPDRP
ncbi:hypothetical protein [Streptomyces sp. CBMA156]|uniref:hypothetical protein n=1 Tax=Streptomyces sp. CBMA156 TaxID=1930280 RepID=UPI001661A073|nr:hypothetical protein [Streptomyces sp. CBMA156]MBD0669387.1 hypothetical protein [Streptomyces sp. CBMA156]